VCGDGLPAKRNPTAPQFFQAQVSSRVNFDALPTFEEMPKTPMTPADITVALPPADFGVSTICVGAPVDREEQDVQEENMEVEGVEEVDENEMGESDAVGSGEEEIHDMTTSSTDVGDGAGGGRRRTASSRVSGEQWGQRA
jgi:hypothetical protein